MPLNDYEPPLLEVKTAEGSVLGTVRGLSLHDLRVLAQDNLGTADKLASFIDYLALRKAPAIDALTKAGDDPESFLLTLIQDIPDLGEQIIALGGEVENIAQVRRLPLGTQVVLLERIFEATFTEVGGVKKFWQVLGQVIGRMLPQQSPDPDVPKGK